MPKEGVSDTLDDQVLEPGVARVLNLVQRQPVLLESLQLVELYGVLYSSTVLKREPPESETVQEMVTLEPDTRVLGWTSKEETMGGEVSDGGGGGPGGDTTPPYS